MIITQTPLRIGLVGGGTDLPDFYRRHGGRVLNCAIDKYVYVVVKERFDDDIYVNYSKKEIVGKVDEIQHDLVREAMVMAGVERAVELTVLADIPSAGSGLGSSSSLTVGLVQALFAYRGRSLPAAELAERACAIEIERCGKHIGKQDQYIAAFGGVRDLRFGPGECVVADEVALSLDELRALQAQLLLFYTGITRSADAILNEQRDNIDDTLALLTLLRSLAGEAVDGLRNGSVSTLGPAVRRSWEVKRQLASGVSNAVIDSAIAAALDAGAVGAKVTGAGGGGFLLVVAPMEHQARVREHLSHMRELPIKIDRFGSRVVLNVARDIWS